MKHFIFIVLSLFLFVLYPFFSFAEENEITLDKVVVTATRDAEEIRKVPAHVTVITREKIEKSNAQSIPDVLKEEVGAVVRDYSGTGKNVTLDLRGFGEAGPLNTLVLVDGRRVNAIDLSGVDWTQIPLDQVERIEIVRGSGSVLYGDNAVGGVVNIITKRPEKTLMANAEVTGGSYHYYKTDGSVGGKWGPFSAILNAGYHTIEGYRDNGLLRAKDAGGKMIYDLNKDVSFDFSGNLHRDDTGLPGALPENLYRSHREAAQDLGNGAGTDDSFGVFGIKARLWETSRIEADLSYRTREVNDFFFTPSGFFTGFTKNKRKLKTWGWTPKYILELPLGNFANKLTVGLDYYYSNSNIFVESVYGGFPSQDHSEVTKKSTGLYFYDEFSILKELIFSAGYRNEWATYDLYQESALLKEKVRNREPAWNLALNYLFGKNSSAFLSVKRSFRFPASDELIVYDTITWMPVLNPSMKPQTGNHYEAGVRHAFTDQIEANLTLFWIDTKDEIFFDPDTYNNENFSKTRRQGLEVGVKTRPWPWLVVWGNYGYMKPTLRGRTLSGIDLSGNDIPSVPRHKGAVGADVDFGKGFQLSTKANIVGASYFISDWENQVGKLDGYYTWDAKLTFTWNKLKAFVGVNNLTNRKYAEYGVLNSAKLPYYYPSPDRNFIGGIAYTF